MRASIAFAAIAGLAVASCSQEPAEPVTSPVTAGIAADAAAVGYACESGKTIAVAYPDQSTARLSYEGRDYSLTSRTSASGALYAGEGLEWHTASREGQETGLLSREGAGGAAGTVLERCARPAPDLTPSLPPAAAPGGVLIAAPVCAGESLKLSSEDGDAGMGNRVAVLGVQNTGAAACSVTGYPEIDLRDSRDRPLTSIRAEQNPGNYFRQGQAPAPVTIAPGAKAYFDLAWNVVPHEGNGETRCPEARTIRLMLAGDEAAASLAQTFTPCGGYIRVSPFRPVVDGSAGTSPQS